MSSLMQNKLSLNYFMRASAKNAWKTLKVNLARNFEYMTNVFNYNHFNTIIDITNRFVYEVSCQTKQVWTTLFEKVPKNT